MIVSHLRRVHVGMSRWKENLLGRQIRSVGQCRLVEEILFTIFLKHIWHTIANTNTSSTQFCFPILPAEGWTVASGSESFEVSVRIVRIANFPPNQDDYENRILDYDNTINDYEKKIL